MVVLRGNAVTEEPVDALSVEAGDHIYVLAPPADKVVYCPEHIETGGEAVTTGAELTVM